jgi:hypothetical protein
MGCPPLAYIMGARYMGYGVSGWGDVGYWLLAIRYLILILIIVMVIGYGYWLLLMAIGYGCPLFDFVTN